jgi:polysaccharide export outer membrane protein
VVAVTLVLLAGVVSPTVALSQSTEPTVMPDQAEQETAYRIGADDVLHIDVYDEPDLSGDFVVSAEGTVLFPLIGQVRVQGMDVGAVSTTITDLLAQDYLWDPKVSVAVKEHRSQKVEVLGSVARPGTYYLEGSTRLLDILSRAGGVVTTSSEIRRGQLVRVTRQGVANEGGSATTIHVDLHQLMVEGNDEVNLALCGGDIVYVPQGEQVHVVGEVKRPGSFPFEEGMTVLKAIGLAGGPTPRASTRRVVIRRIEDGRQVRVKAPMEAQLEADDIVEVPIGFW